MPFDPELDLSNDVDDEQYDDGNCPINMRVIVGVLSYAAVTARPDISYIVSVLAGHVTDPRPKHVKAAYYLISYVAGTVNLGMEYARKVDSRGADDWRFEISTDADWARDRDTRRSRSGLLVV